MSLAAHSACRGLTFLLALSLIGVEHVASFSFPMAGRRWAALPQGLRTARRGGGLNHGHLAPRSSAMHRHSCPGWHPSMSTPATMKSANSYPDFEFDFESGGEIYAEPLTMSPKEMLRTMREEAAAVGAGVGSVMERQLRRNVIDRATLAEAVAGLMARKICDTDLLEELLHETFLEVMEEHPRIIRDVVADLRWIKEIDPATRGYIQPFLYFKGFHAVTAQRIGHHLWNDPLPARNMLALALQSRSAELFGVDAHPGARLKHAVFFDHASGCVIGETASIGHHCYVLHGVTLGATGKTGEFDRHPKVGNRVKIGAGAMILGNIPIEDGAVVGAAAVVTVPVRSGETVVGINRILSPSMKRKAAETSKDPETWLYTI